MSLEREKLSEVSNLQKDLNEIALVETLEEEGIHVHSLLKTESNQPDALLLAKIDKTLHEQTESTREPTFAQRNRIITRRKSRNVALSLIRRHR